MKVQFKSNKVAGVSTTQEKTTFKKPDTAPAQSIDEFDFRKFNLGGGSATQKMQYLQEVKKLIVEDKNHLKVFKDTVSKIKKSRCRKSQTTSRRVASPDSIDETQNTITSQEVNDFVSMNASLQTDRDYRDNWKGFFKEKSEYNRFKAKQRAQYLREQKKTEHII